MTVRTKLLSVPSTRVTTILIKVKPCNALLRMVLVRTSIYLKSALRYKFLIFDTYCPDRLYLCEIICEDLGLFFEDKWGPRANITGFIKEQRLNWLSHVERMAEDNVVKKITRWKPMSKRPIGRPKKRWEDDVLEDIKSMNVCNWKNVAQNRDRWKKVVEQARTLNRL